MLKQGNSGWPMRRFFFRKKKKRKTEKEKQKSPSQNRTFSKIKLLLRLAAFIDALLPEEGLVYTANEKWDLNQLVHVHLVSMVIVSLGIWDTRYLMPMYYLLHSL